jgi:hypothetical protein
MAEIMEALTAPHQLAYTYKRSLGPVLSQFFTALREKKILGIRRSDGTVMVPPKEYDPDTAESLSEMVEVADARWADAPEGRMQDITFVPEGQA